MLQIINEDIFTKVVQSLLILVESLLIYHEQYVHFFMKCRVWVNMTNNQQLCVMAIRSEELYGLNQRQLSFKGLNVGDILCFLSSLFLWTGLLWMI